MSETWMWQASCRHLTDEQKDRLFFPLGNTDMYGDSRRKICSACPVQIQCLDYGEYISPDQGAWGGFTPKQRSAMRKAKRKWVTASDSR